MIRKRMEKFFDLLNGRTLDSVYPVCEMLIFEFGNISLHVQCFARITQRNKILLTTLDYQNWDEITDINNDEWYHLSQYREIIVNNCVIKAELTAMNDIFIRLENDISIQIFISNGAPHYIDECEQWRIFEKDNEEDLHIVVYADKVELHE